MTRRPARRVGWLARVLVALAAACIDGAPVAPSPAPITLAVTGIIERGADAWISATRADSLLAPSAVTWSVDDTTVARITVVGDRATLRGLAAGRTTRLRAQMGSDTGALAITVRPPPTIAFAWRPASGTSSNDIYRVALDGTDLVNLTDGSPLADERPAVAGARIVFASFRANARSLLYQIPVTGGAATPLSTLTTPRSSPSLNANGTRVAFVSPVGGVDRVFIGDGAQTNAPLTDGFGSAATIEGEPAVAPDGQRIAFWSTARGDPEVYVVPWSGGTPTRIAMGNSSFSPAWRPDGARLLLASNRDTVAGGPASIYEVNLATNGVRRLTQRGASDADPEYLADGRVVYVAYLSPTTAELRWIYPDIPGLEGRVPLPAGLPTKPRRLP